MNTTARIATGIGIAATTSLLFATPAHAAAGLRGRLCRKEAPAGDRGLRRRPDRRRRRAEDAGGTARGHAGASGVEPDKEIDLRGYAKYLLKEGSVTEKRELLLCIKSRLVLSQKVLQLEKQN